MMIRLLAAFFIVHFLKGMEQEISIEMPALNNNLCDVVLNIYVKNSTREINPLIIERLKQKLQEVQSTPEHKFHPLVGKLHKLSDSDSSSSDMEELFTPVHHLVSETLEELLKTMQTESEALTTHNQLMVRKLEISNKRMKIAALSNILTAIITALITAAVTLTIHFTGK